MKTSATDNDWETKSEDITAQILAKRVKKEAHLKEIVGSPHSVSLLATPCSLAFSGSPDYLQSDFSISALKQARHYVFGLFLRLAHLLKRVEQTAA
jgi:hypothetical protein